MMADEFADIEADTDYDEVNSQYDSCYSSGSDNTTTIASEVTNYKYEHGRRYHSYSEGHYWFPNDDQQNHQLDIFHKVYTLALDNALHLAPIGDAPRNVLDLGTGTGIWAIEMADTHPQARVLGNDLSPIQPAWYSVPEIPENVSFEVDDFTKPWLHGADTFSFIHARALYGSVKDWTRFLREALHALQPGGYFESVETETVMCTETTPDGMLRPGAAIVEWSTLANQAAERAGRIFDVAPRMRAWMEDAGFEDVHEKVFKLPVGPWPKDPKMKEIGRWNLLNLLEASEGFTLAIYTRLLGWSVEDTMALLARVDAELKDKRLQLYYRLHVVYGRKPLESGYATGLDTDLDTDADDGLVESGLDDDESAAERGQVKAGFGRCAGGAAAARARRFGCGALSGGSR